MKKLLLMVCATAILAPGTANAVECLASGTTLAWATDQCLLQSGSDNPKALAVQKCLGKADTIKQPCEWNISYKGDYCELLIKKDKYHGTAEACLADPDSIGPTVRKILNEQSDEP